jgi:diguanylate cyclase (GGDEF)-like protein
MLVHSHIRLAAAVVCLSAVAIFVKLFWLDHYSKATIQIQAEASAGDWIEGFEQTVPDLDAILLGEPVRQDQGHFIDATMAASAVFAVEIFDPAGRLLFDSALPGYSSPPNEELNERAQWVARTGSKDLTVEEGDTAADEPEHFVEAYLPFFAGQEQPIGVVELYIDVSGTAAALNTKYGWVGLVAILITALVFVAPGVALVRQNERLRERDAQLNDMARTDGLTGLLNRRGADQDLANAASNLKADDNAWLFQIDLDKFKPINDVFGHAAGDELLIELAERLKSWAGPDDIVARLGGDEFLICRMTNADQAMIKGEAEALRQELIKPVEARGHRCNVGASIGIAMWDSEAEQDITEAVRLADVALQTAKDGGRNQVIIFEPHMQNEVLSQARMAEDVADALLEGQFVAHYQPIYDAGTEDLIGFEALVRWSHPAKGLLLPGTFLPAAKKAGLVDQLDRIVLEDALEFAATLKALGREDVQISLNLDDTRLKQRGVANEYAAIVNARGLSTSQFRIELLESTLLDERSNDIVENIKRLHKAGFKIDLDDFGTGHAAIGSLQRFPVDRIKIDRSLMAGVSENKDLSILASVIVSLGQQLNIEVVAEGIEVQADLDVVKTMKVDAIQGFIFAKAMSPDECQHLLHRSSEALSA